MTDLSSQPVSFHPNYVCVGFDVAKDKLDLARSDTGELLCLANDPQGIKHIVELFKATWPACIVVESTGGLERPLLHALLDAGLPVALVLSLIHI